MSACCDHDGVAGAAQAAPCPKCGISQKKPVACKTVLHHLRRPYVGEASEDTAYYFCGQPTCEIVYFSREGQYFSTHDMRWPIGQKSTQASRQICYCFDVTYGQALAELKNSGKSKIKEFVIRQTKIRNCACDIRNPSGKCCLADFPKL